MPGTRLPLKVSANPLVVEAARMSLATIVLGLVHTESMTPDGLRTMAVAMFCARHRIEVDPADPGDRSCVGGSAP